MKKILCPVDFSDAATNGMEYAAQLAKELDSSLTLLYVRPSIWPEAVQLEQEVAVGLENIGDRLGVYSQEVQTEFGITCDAHIEQTVDTVEMAIAAEAGNYDMIVMGTNGADDVYQYVFGTHSFHVIEQAKCPVIVIPEGYTYRPLRKIVYAYDPETNPVFLIEQLKTLAFPLNAEVKVLHIASEKRSPEEEQKLTVIIEAMKARETRHIPWSVDFQYSDDVPGALDHYLRIHDADMLALSCHHQTWIEKLFKPDIVKEISMIADYPVLAFWN
jgi:nucleotide-binding universal stress UspA family protein